MSSSRCAGSRWGVTALGAAAVIAVVGALLGGPAGAASAESVRQPLAASSAPVPHRPGGVPPGVEAPARYVPQNSCDPDVKPGTAKLIGLLEATYPGTSAFSSRPCAVEGPGRVSEHYEGRAVDWMVSVRTARKADAQAFLRFLLQPDVDGVAFGNARRLGVMYVIWDGRIWGAYNPAAGWRAYSSCTSHPETSWDTTCHRDHVHLSLSWAGAMGRTSWWTGSVAGQDYGPCRAADLNWAPPYSGRNPTPCPVRPSAKAPSGVSSLGARLVRLSGARVEVGSTGPVVTAVQQALKLPADGAFGPRTAAAVSSFRTAHGLPAGTAVTSATWRALLEEYARPGAASAGAKGGSLARYAGTTLRYGDRGAAVGALQKALRVTPVSGWFGPVTRASVKAFQKAHGLRPTGVVGRKTWKALGA